MNLDNAVDLARAGELYPSVILHGGDEDGRGSAALELARTLLCARASAERPCGDCPHCRRMSFDQDAESPFHPDFQVLRRDLRTATSVDAAREFLRTAQVTPFEARGQVFVVAAADSLTPEAANAFLKTLEEPHTGSPRHFLLLAGSQFDLLPTLRSRSLAIYLGGAAAVESSAVAELAEALGRRALAFQESANRTELFAMAALLDQAGDWRDPRAKAGWEVGAAALLRASRSEGLGRPLRSRLLSLADDLLTGPEMRVRSIQPLRILEGLVHRHLEITHG